MRASRQREVKLQWSCGRRQTTDQRNATAWLVPEDTEESVRARDWREGPGKTGFFCFGGFFLTVLRIDVFTLKAIKSH